MSYRIERDTMGEVKVPDAAAWGAQTQRSRENFRIGDELMPIEIVRALGVVKMAAAAANVQLGVLDAEKGAAIAGICTKIINGELDAQFPLKVWQTGSGTQTNMNVNEVIAHLTGLHPNDDINKSQSSNDTFPSAIHIAAVLRVEHDLLPSIKALVGTFSELSARYASVVKIGRTHLQDATPLTLGAEISAWAEMLSECESAILSALAPVRKLALGGTAVGTGLNAPAGFSEIAIAQISKITGSEFAPAENKYHALSSKDAICNLHGTFKTLAADLLKIANDVRWLASGPRCGIGEINIPENEPGSSIMPGKVNPTQCEALSMVAAQVLGNDVTVGIAAASGNFQLNVFMPVIAYNVLQSARLLADSLASFDKNCAKGITANEVKISEHLRDSLMLVTALAPKIGYEKTAKVAKKAHAENTSIREAALNLGVLTDKELGELLDPSNMI
jgi:fumarate hydratase class II